MTDLRATFRRPFPEQVAAWLLRLANPVPTSRWDDISRDAHNAQFMVAGAIKADLLDDLGRAVSKVIIEGVTFEEFKRDFRALVTKNGWHGWTGEGTAKGEEWRMRVIYNTNVRQSYMAGRLAQLIDGDYPFWIYLHGGSVEPRLQHLAWNGIALPPNHPFWIKNLPPNGWGCSCLVEGARSESGIRRMGGDPNKVLPEGWDQINPRTGTPAGIDKGWDYAPGMTTAATVLALKDKLDKLPEQLSTDLIQDWLKHSAFEDWFRAPIGLWPLVRLSQADALSIGSTKTVASMSETTARKQVLSHPEITVQEYAQAQRVVETAQNRLTDIDPKTGTRSRIFILEEPEGSGGYVLVVKATLTGEGLFVTSFRRLSRQQALRDAEISRLLTSRNRGAAPNGSA